MSNNGSNGRDGKGRFAKGHPALNTQPGRKGGRPKSPKTEVKEALALAEDAMPVIIKAMIERASNCLDKDSQRAAEYLMDRVYGKARQPFSGELRQMTYRVVYDDEPESEHGNVTPVAA